MREPIIKGVEVDRNIRACGADIYIKYLETDDEGITRKLFLTTKGLVVYDGIREMDAYIPIFLPELLACDLASALWNAGYRPKEAAGSIGQLDSTKAHLSDMRRLVFDERPIWPEELKKLNGAINK